MEGWQGAGSVEGWLSGGLAGVGLQAGPVARGPVGWLAGEFDGWRVGADENTITQSECKSFSSVMARVKLDAICKRSRVMN